MIIIIYNHSIFGDTLFSDKPMYHDNASRAFESMAGGQQAFDSIRGLPYPGFAWMSAQPKSLRSSSRRKLWLRCSASSRIV